MDEKIKAIEEIIWQLGEEKIGCKRDEKTDSDQYDYYDFVALQKVMNKLKYIEKSYYDFDALQEAVNKLEDIEKLDLRDEVLNVVNEGCINVKPDIEPHIKFTNDNLINEENILIKTARGKMHAKTFNYDYDASLISSYIFCKTIDIPEEGEWHIDFKGGYEYKIRKGNGLYFRGDTMTSWLTSLNKYLDLYGSLKFPEIPKKPEGRIEYLCNQDNYHKVNDNTEKDDIYEAVMEFIEVVYTIGNFCPVPIGFNEARSNFGDYDYWDLTLMKIREWYHCSLYSSSLHERDKLIYEDLLHNMGNSLACLRWLESFGQGKMGWHNFVDTLHMQDYVDNDYEVIPFWDGHEWDKENGKVKVAFPEGKNEIKKAFETMTNIIRARSKRIAEALVRKTKK